MVGRRDSSVTRWLKKLGLEFYYPKIRQLAVIPRRHLSHNQRAASVQLWRSKLVPMFPRYLFVCFDWYAIAGARSSTWRAYAA
jgi:hypothetical protein